MQKDQMQTDLIKQKQIEEIKSLDKSKMFIPPPPKKKMSLLKKILIAFGYGEKGRNI